MPFSQENASNSFDLKQEEDRDYNHDYDDDDEEDYYNMSAKEEATGVYAKLIKRRLLQSESRRVQISSTSQFLPPGITNGLKGRRQGGTWACSSKNMLPCQCHCIGPCTATTSSYYGSSVDSQLPTQHFRRVVNLEIVSPGPKKLERRELNSIGTSVPMKLENGTKVAALMFTLSGQKRPKSSNIARVPWRRRHAIKGVELPLTAVDGHRRGSPSNKGQEIEKLRMSLETFQSKLLLAECRNGGPSRGSDHIAESLGAPSLPVSINDDLLTLVKCTKAPKSSVLLHNDDTETTQEWTTCSDNESSSLFCTEILEPTEVCLALEGQSPKKMEQYADLLLLKCDEELAPWNETIGGERVSKVDLLAGAECTLDSKSSNDPRIALITNLTEIIRRKALNLTKRRLDRHKLGLTNVS